MILPARFLIPDPNSGVAVGLLLFSLVRFALAKPWWLARADEPGLGVPFGMGVAANRTDCVIEEPGIAALASARRMELSGTALLVMAAAKPALCFPAAGVTDIGGNANVTWGEAAT